MCRGVIDIEAQSPQAQDAQCELRRKGGDVPDFCSFQQILAGFVSPVLQQLLEPAFQHLWPEKG